MKKTILIILFLIPVFFYSQDISEDLKKIDSIVKLIDNSEKKYTNKTIKGTSENINKPNYKGNWEANYLHHKNIPSRILYNHTDKEKSENFEFYYESGKLIFIKLDANFYKRKTNKMVNQKCYLKNLKKIKCDNTKTKEYEIDFLMTKEKRIKDFYFR